MSVDQMFEKTGTPYQYTYQNPIKYTDPTGMEGEVVNKPDDWVIRGKQIFFDASVSGDEQIKAKYGDTANRIDFMTYSRRPGGYDPIQRFVFNPDGTFTETDLSASVIDRALGNAKDVTYAAGGDSVLTAGGDLIIRFGATIDVPRINPFRGKTDFEILMVDTNPTMSLIAGSVAPPLGFISGGAQTYGSFRDGDYIGAAVGVATLAISAKMSGSPYQWGRYGSSYSKTLGQETVGFRWGASPYHAATKIPNPGMQKLNQLLRKTSLPVKDKLGLQEAGHFHTGAK